MDIKGHEKFNGKFRLSNILAGRKVRKMEGDRLQTKPSIICQAKFAP
jgi:hypothetical protein